jgi:hypothetical protein
MFSFSHVFEKLHWLLGRGYLLGCSVIFAPETFFVISAVLAQEEPIVLPSVR